MKVFQKNRAVFLIPWLTDFAGFLVIFAVGRDLAETNADLARMGVVGACFPSALGMTSVCSGWLSDHLGRRPMILAGLVLLMACLYAAAGYHYIPAYVIGGIGLGMIYPPCVAWLTQGCAASGARSAMSRMLILFCLSWNLGMLSGQVAGGWLFEMDTLYPLLTGACLAAAAMIVAVLSPPTAAAAMHDEGHSAKNDLAHRAQAASFARLSRVANLGGAFAMSTIIFLFPHTAVDVGIDSGIHGVLLGATRVVIVLVYLLMHFTSFWHFNLVTAMTSQSLAFLGMLLLAFAGNVWWIAVALVAAAQVQGYNYFSGLYYSTAGSSDERRGASSGLHEATISAGIAVGALAGGILGAHWHPRAPYFLGAVVIVVLMIIQVVVRKKAGMMLVRQTSGTGPRPPLLSP